MSATPKDVMAENSRISGQLEDNETSPLNARPLTEVSDEELERALEISRRQVKADSTPSWGDF
jgi:hypothetical protein